MEQRTEEWFAARAGKVTASRVKDVMMSKTTAGYQNYRSQLVCELLTGQPTETHTSAAMQHGTDTEPQARAMYTLTTGNMVQEVGFIPHPLIAGAGASPDGLVGERGLVEIKCPQPTEHIRTLTGGAIKKDYLLQMQWQMACTGREWCDFVSYSNDFPDELRLHVQRVTLDYDLIMDMEKAVTAFCAEVQDLLETLKQKAAA